jgi:hypothetical protein
MEAYETLHTIHTRLKGKKSYMMVKVDMSKAYDWVECKFLEAVMRRLGFAECWIQLIMMCVTTVEYAVMVNGKPCGKIISKRGICQEDLISPYLFLIYVESLSALINNANGMGALTGVPTSRRGPRINHLFFADNSLFFFFCRASATQWERLHHIL